MMRSLRHSMLARPAGAAHRIWLYLLSSSLSVRVLRQFSKKDVARWRWETTPLEATEKICVFVTYSPDGTITERASRHAAIWRDAGYEILFVVALDHFDVHPQIPFGHAICRENLGHDFAAWSRALAIIPLERTKFLATVNDSVFASQSLSSAIARAESSSAEVVGFTECREYRWHMQSYAVVFKRKCIQSAAFSRFWKPRLGSRSHAILTYEIPLASEMISSGQRVEILFPLDVKENPTDHHLPDLLDQGFPYLKRSSLLQRYGEWRDLFAIHGFDAALVRNELDQLRLRDNRVLDKG